MSSDLQKNRSRSVGRPVKPDKKVSVHVKLPPWLVAWSERQPESRAVLIEDALVNYYQIPDGVIKSYD